jgi:general secretion pathway protein F/type IV pilus assembly protein PilC
MASFRYKVLKKDGSLAEGSLEAGSRGEATRRLNEQGSRVLSLTEEAVKEKAKKKPAKSDAPDKPVKKSTSAPVENRLSSKQLVQFTEELSDLLAAGVQLDAALHSIGKRSESEAISRVAGACYEKVRDGVPLATALRLSSPSFNELYCNLVSAGEISGALGDILKRQVRYLNTLAELRGKLATALIYPAFLIVSGVGVSAMFVFFLIPKLRRLVESTGGELPPVAKLLLSTGDFLKANWIAVLVVLLVAVVVVFVAFQRESTKRWWDEAKLKLPLFGKLLVTRFNVQFVETLANLLVNGLPIVRALELVETTTPNRYIREQIIQMRARVSEGAMLNRCMEKAGIFESGLVDMTRIGEDTGQLAPSIAKAGDRLDREFGRAIERIASVIQPAIILVMSVVVGLMAYMMISVIYETISVLRNR